jgi:hypothetical protein
MGPAQLLGVPDEPIPFHFSVGVYPNPFNPTTTIEYEVPQNTFVSITIFDILGREVAHLVNETRIAGQYTLKWDASSFPTGFYYCRMQASGFVEVKKLILLK